MVSKQSLSTKHLGKILTPKQIFSFEFDKNVKVVFERATHDRIHYDIIFYFFIGSFFLSLITYFIFFDFFYFLLIGFMRDSFSQFLTLTVCFALLNIAMYWSVLIFFFLYYDSKFVKYEEEIEESLPDFLDNLVSNLKGGFILEKALLRSVREDQKALLEEMTLINEKIMSGKSVMDSLEEMQKKFSSQVISRTLFLIMEGLKGGGNLAVPLQRISENLKKIYMLNEEVKSSVGGFSMIIRMIGSCVAPALFSLAITLLVFISELLILLSKGEEVFASVQALPVEYVTYLTIFSYAMLVLISVFSSLIISQLNNEEIYRAIKSIPIVLLISCLIYYFLSQLLINYFSTVI